uniref:AAA+ ATPase domain-containing protein n=1 Tax=Timema monikensis TaxID=170555 RepID=A0A7R9E2C4_9NEOP|nr:unnamed protein product [Timema monikensis]
MLVMVVMTVGVILVMMVVVTNTLHSLPLRFVWFLAFLASLVTCFFLINKVWEKWDESPVILSFREKVNNVREIPFPAVTVCNDNKVKTSYKALEPLALEDRHTNPDTGYCRSDASDHVATGAATNIDKIWENDISYASVPCEYIYDPQNRSILNNSVISQFMIQLYAQFLAYPTGNGVIRDEEVYSHLHGGRGENHFGKTTLSTSDLDSNPNLIIGSLVYCESNALDHAATEAAPTCDEMMTEMKWQGEKQNACDHFKQIATEDGICYTFNMMPFHQLLQEDFFFGVSQKTSYNHSNDWTLDNGYVDYDSKESIPRRSLGAGMKYGLQFTLYQMPDEINRRCSGPYTGFKLMLHSPVDVPLPEQEFCRVSTNEEFVFAVKPSYTTTQNALKKMEPTIRGCFFSQEKMLKYFQQYTQRNCEVECLTNASLVYCGCIMYYMPVRIKLQDMAYDTKKEPLQLLKSENCHCLPSCTEINYDLETSSSTQDWEGYLNETGQKRNGTRWTKVVVFFKQEQFISLYRRELFGITDFVASEKNNFQTVLSSGKLIHTNGHLTQELRCSDKVYGWWLGTIIVPVQDGDISRVEVHCVEYASKFNTAHDSRSSQIIHLLKVLPSIANYLEDHKDIFTHVDIDAMADYLQNKYRDYSKKKRRPFRVMASEGNRANEQLMGLYYPQKPKKNPRFVGENELIDICSDDEPEPVKVVDVNKEMFSNSMPNISIVPIGLKPKKSSSNVTSSMTAKNLPSKTRTKSGTSSPPASLVNMPAPSMPDKSTRVSAVLPANESTPQSSLGTGVKKRKPQLEENGFLPNKRRKEFTVSYSNDVSSLIFHMSQIDSYRALGISPPRGFLLHGPPGCGKTLLAQVIAGELRVPLLKVSSPALVAGVSGESESRIRDLFDQALSLAPCVVFLDEVDAITPNRHTAQREMERRIVSQLLSCLDELGEKEGGNNVLVIGATNRPDSIDPALRRAGRFDREVSIGIPDTKARTQILKVACKNMKLEPSFNYKEVAKNAPGYVGADLIALAREASMIALESERQSEKDRQLV